MKKLLVVSDSFLPRWDGVSRFLHEILPELSKKFEVTVIAPLYQGTLPYLGENRLIRIPTYSFKLGDYSPPRLARRIIREEVSRCDFVWIQTIGILGGYAIRYANRKGKKISAFIHSVEWELYSEGLSHAKLVKRAISYITKSYMRRHYNKCHLLFLPSQEILSSIRSIGITSPAKIVHLGTDTKKFIPPKDKEEAKRKVGIDPHKIVIGYVGRIGKEKDVPTLHAAFMSLKKWYPDSVLIIVGEGNKNEESKLHGENVMRLGKMDNVVPYLQAMDIYVLPSLTETSSLSTMEAMACGVAVVTTPVGHLIHYIKDGINGFFFPAKDAQFLEAVLRRLIDKPHMRRSAGIEARKTIVKEYRWSQTREKIIKEFLIL